MLCCSSRRSEACLHSSGSPTNSGTIWVALDITGRPAALRIALTRAARSWCRSRSQFEVLRWRIAAVAAGDAAAARAVHADGVHFVDIGHRIVALGEIADRSQRRDVAVHRIEALAGDQLGTVGSGGAQQFFQMREVAVAEDLALAAALTDAFDHRIMVERVRLDQAVRNEFRDR